jgi:hypothetical protein
MRNIDVLPTAVEYLEKKLDDALSDTDYLTWQLVCKAVREAKEMEKRQIIDAHGNKTKKSGGVSNHTYILTGEEYYNETFKQNEV